MDVKNKLINVTYYLIAFVLIIGSLAVGNAIQKYFDTAIPGSIFGMLLLFSAMASGLLPSKWVKSGANLIIRFMVLLFVPISVGLMEHIDMLVANALPIIASAIGGSLIVLVSLALFLDRLLTKGN